MTTVKIDGKKYTLFIFKGAITEELASFLARDGMEMKLVLLGPIGCLGKIKKS